MILLFDLLHLSFLVGGDEDEDDGRKAAEENLKNQLKSRKSIICLPGSPRSADGL